MKHILAAFLLAIALSCSSAQSGTAPEMPAAAAAEGGAAPAATIEAPVVGSVAEEAPAAEDAPAEELGLTDKILAILKSTEAIIGSLIAILTLLGIGAGIIKKLKDTKEALHTVAHKIEEHKGKHAAAGTNLKKNISDAAPRGSAVGSIIHASAKVAEARVNGGKV